MLRFQRAAQNKAIGLSVAAVAADVVLAGVGAKAAGEGDWGKAVAADVFGQVLLGLGLQLAFLASVNGYGRGLETEADEGGFAKLAAAGYRLSEAPKVYAALLEDHGEPKKVEAFFFGNHPRLSERIESSKHYLAAHSAKPADGKPAGDPDAFARRIRPVVRDDARLNIALGRFRIAEAELDKAKAWMPEDGKTRFYIGHLRLAQADAAKDPGEQKRLRQQAGDAFREAIHLDAARPSPHRDLGILLYDQGELRDACREFKRYVELAPHADDAGQVQDYILELKKGKHCK